MGALKSLKYVLARPRIGRLTSTYRPLTAILALHKGMQALPPRSGGGVDKHWPHVPWGIQLVTTCARPAGGLRRFLAVHKGWTAGEGAFHCNFTLQEGMICGRPRTLRPKHSLASMRSYRQGNLLKKVRDIDHQVTIHLFFFRAWGEESSRFCISLQSSWHLELEFPATVLGSSLQFPTSARDGG